MSFPSRRDFLQDSLLAAAAAAASRSALANDAPAPADGAKPAGPNGRVRVAVIGVRGQGRAHLRWLLNEPDTEIAAVCDADLADDIVGPAVQMVEKARGKAPAVVQDLRKIFDDKSIDAVTIATPDHWHALAAVWAMQAGKDVYVEKPIAHDVREGRAIVNWSRKLGRIVQAGTQRRSFRAMQEAVRFVREGGIGKIRLARAIVHRPRKTIGRLEGAPKVPPTVDFDLWCGPGPKVPPRRVEFHYDWHWFWDYGTGEMGNNGVHQIDVCRWMLGKQELPKSILSVGGRYAWDDDGETPNAQVAVYDWGDAKLVAEVRSLPSDPCPGPGRVGEGFLIYGEKGVLASDKTDHAAAFDADGKLVREFEGDGKSMRNFLDAVKSRRREDQFAEIQDGHLSSAICLLGNVSWRLSETQAPGPSAKPFGDDAEGQEAVDRLRAHLTGHGVDFAKTPLHVGRRLTFDPAAEKFTGENAEAANALLGREYRTPFVVPHCS